MGNRRGRGQGRAQGREREDREARIHTADENRAGRNIRNRSSSPKRENTAGYRDRGMKSGQRDEGWLPNGSAYVYDGVRLHPESWHRYKLDKPQMKIREKHWDSWKYYRSRGHGHKIPKELDMPHIMAPHPIYGPQYAAKMSKDGQQDSNARKGPKSNKDGPERGTINAKQTSVHSKPPTSTAPTSIAPTSTDPRTPGDKYCLLCKSHSHWHEDCAAEYPVKFWPAPFEQHLPVDLTKFRHEKKDFAPRNLAALIEHIFVTCSSLRMHSDWCSARNIMQGSIYDSFYGAEEMDGEPDMPKSTAMLRRIGKLNLIVDETVSRLNKIVKTFNVAWLKEFRDQGLGITTELGRQAEKNNDLVRRLYTTPQPTDWPFPALESLARGLSEEAHKLRDEYLEEVSEWKHDLYRYIDDISLASRLDIFEAHAYQALIDNHARIGVDHSAWLNFIIVPEAPDQTLVDRIYLGPLHDNLEESNLRIESVEKEQGEFMEEDGNEHLPDEGSQLEEDLSRPARSFAV